MTKHGYGQRQLVHDCPRVAGRCPLGGTGSVLVSCQGAHAGNGESELAPLRGIQQAFDELALG
jgi:hypothetical protein